MGETKKTKIGLWFEVTGYQKFKDVEYDKEVVFKIDGKEKVITFKEFEEFIGLKNK